MKMKCLTGCLAIAIGAMASAQAETIRYHANLTSPDVIASGAPLSTAEILGSASFVLETDPDNLAATTLSYQIDVPGIDLDGNQTADLSDDATAAHIHDVTQCVSVTCIDGDTAGTKHVLNIFGAPRQDDVDLQTFPEIGRITGIWDSSDKNSLTPAPSLAPSEVLTQLANGDIFLMVHSREFPDGVIGGFLVPEPNSMTVALGCLMGLCACRQVLRAS